MGVVAQGVLHLLRPADVGQELEGGAVGRGVRQGDFAHHAIAAGAQGLLLVEVGGERLRRRIDDDEPGLAVDEERVAGAHRGHQPFHPDHGRDVQGTRHDGRMTRPTAFLRDERRDARLMQAGRLRGGQVQRDDHLAAGDRTDFRRSRAEELVEHAAGDVADVGGALAEEIVLHLGEDIDVALRDRLEAVLDVVAGAPDLLGHLIDEGDVLQHQQVGVEDCRLGLVKFTGDIRAQLGDLHPGSGQGDLEPGQFPLRVVDPPANHEGTPLLEQVGGRPGHAGGGGGPEQPDFGPMGVALHPAGQKKPPQGGSKAD